MEIIADRPAEEVIVRDTCSAGFQADEFLCSRPISSWSLHQPRPKRTTPTSEVSTPPRPPSPTATPIVMRTLGVAEGFSSQVLLVRMEKGNECIQSNGATNCNLNLTDDFQFLLGLGGATVQRFGWPVRTSIRSGPRRMAERWLRGNYPTRRPVPADGTAPRRSG